MKTVKWLSLLVALSLLLTGAVAAMAEDEIFSAPVDARVEESADVGLWTEDAAEAVAKAQMAADAQQAAEAPKDGVAINASNFPDAAFREYISEEIDTESHDGVLSSSEIEEATGLFVEERGIRDLTGLEYFTELTQLICDGNQLTRLDLTHNTKLLLLACTDNRISDLNLSKCTRLWEVHCTGNRLQTLDVTHNPNMEWLECADNLLTTLDLTNCRYMIACAQETPEIDDGVLEFSLFYDGEEDDEYEYHLFVDEGVVLTADGETLYGTPTDAPVSIEGAKVTGVKSATYTGEAIKPRPVVKLDGVKLVRGTDYSVYYKDNKKIGKATVTIKGIGAYTGTVKKTFRINPKKVAVSKLTAGSGRLTVRWAKTAGGAGYQIQCGLKSKYKSAKPITITGNSTVKKVIKKLKKGKVYYVRIRGYKKVDGVEYVSAWSAAKHVKVK